MSSEFEAGSAIALAIAGMAVVTYLTRIGGVVVMGFVPITRRVESFLRHLACSVMVSIIAVGAARGDPAAWIALVAALAFMVLTRSSPLAMLGGMAVAAGTRALTGT